MYDDLNKIQAKNEENFKLIINSYKNTISINLGNNILRTETATISILSLLKLINNNTM